MMHPGGKKQQSHSCPDIAGDNRACGLLTVLLRLLAPVNDRRLSASGDGKRLTKRGKRFPVILHR